MEEKQSSTPAHSCLREQEYQPKENEWFWYIDSLGNVAYKHEWGSSGKHLVKYGNCFQTEQEAEKVAAKVRAIFKEVKNSLTN